MPCTFTHPLAVVPFNRQCPARLNFAALVIGSMSPDFGYYAHQFPVARFAHTILGTFAVCLPTTLVVLVVFYALRLSLCYVLPQPHRGVLMPLASASPDSSLKGWGIAVISILIGAWTHTVWDSFTHEGAWSVERLAFLRIPILHLGRTTLPLHYLLQQISTFGGGLLLGWLYWRWLRRAPSSSLADDPISDRARYLLLGTFALISVMVALPFAWKMSLAFHGYTAFRVLVFRTGVYAAATFIPLFIMTSLVIYLLFGRVRKS